MLQEEKDERVSSSSDLSFDTDLLSSGMVDDTRSPLTALLEQWADPIKRSIKYLIFNSQKYHSICQLLYLQSIFYI